MLEPAEETCITVPNYYMIFKARNHFQTYGSFVCIVDREEVAADFCHEHEGFYYMSNEQWRKMK